VGRAPWEVGEFLQGLRQQFKKSRHVVDEGPWTWETPTRGEEKGGGFPAGKEGVHSKHWSLVALYVRIANRQGELVEKSEDSSISSCEGRQRSEGK